MATITTTINGEPCILFVPDAFGEAVVNGKVWRWEFHEYLGPGWLRKDGEPRKCQCPTNKAVWNAFYKWLAERKSTRKRVSELTNHKPVQKCSDVEREESPS